jgi:GNAT superfamily N-acetyltransferase
MDIVIRPARPEEYPTVAEITAEVCLGDGLLDFGESDPYLGKLRGVAERAAVSEVLVAVDGERVLGSVTFVTDGSPMADFARAGEAEIRMLAVAREARGRGAGKPSCAPVSGGHGLWRAAVRAWCCPPRAACTAPTASTSAWASPVRPTATGTRFRSSTTSGCSLTS